MLASSKQNIFDLEKPTTSQSTRRHSTFSTSACKKMLKSICQDSELSIEPSRNHFQSINNGEPTIREIKLKETINILQKKNNKQTEEIIVLTQDLNTLAKVRQEELKNLEIQMEKIKKCQMQKNMNTKTINELKKKISELQKENASWKAKSVQGQKKFIKLKQLLRKKEISLTEMTSKLEQNDNLDNLSQRQKQQLQCLRQGFIKAKQKQSIIQEQNQLFKAKLSQYKKQEHDIKTKNLILEQENKRLQQQYEQLENHYEQSKKESTEIEEQMKQTIECQGREIRRLREIVEKIQKIQEQNKNSKFGDVFKEEMTQLLKANIHDRGARARLEKSLHEIIDNMEQSTSRIMMHIIANNL